MVQKILKKVYDNYSNKIVKYEDGSFRLNSKYKLGKIKIENNSAIFEELFSTKRVQKIYIDFDKLNGAYTDDIVVVQVLFNPKGKIKAKVIYIVEKAKRQVLCFVKDKELYSIKDGISIDCDIVNNQDGDVVIFDDDKIISKLGNINNPAIDKAISLYLYDEFYRLDGFESFDIPTPSIKDRVDLTHLDFCTIDPALAKDHDDALYFDISSNTLYVAIADVSAYVLEGSSLDLEALKRSFSIYFPTEVLPMLPFELSSDICSLVPNKQRLAYVFELKLEKQTVKSAKLYEAIIKSKHKYSYEEIDNILEQNEQENYFVKFYNTMKKFRKKRLQNGYDFRSDELLLCLDETSTLQTVITKHSSSSHSLVEECMLLANQEAAKRLQNIGIFRVHTEPSLQKLKQLIDDVNLLGLKVKLQDDIHKTIQQIQQKAKDKGLEEEVDTLIIQSQQQATYSSTRNIHFGLGFDNYSHFTSPIRRYSDLVLHRILKTGKIPKDIDNICEILSQKERSIASLVWDFEDRKFSRYCKEHIYEKFQAKIIDTQNHIAKTTTPIIGAKVDMLNYSGEKLFTTVDLTIKDVDIIFKMIKVKII